MNNIVRLVSKVVTKIFLQAKRITNEKEIKQFGFVKSSGTRNAVFVLRITERAEEKQRDVFVDYTRVFDKVRHDMLFENLGNRELQGKYLQILQSLY